MHTGEYIQMNDKISLFYDLKEELQKKIVNGEVWNDSDKNTLANIRRLSLQTISDIFLFCKKECEDIDNKKTHIIEAITLELEKNFTQTESSKVSLSDLNIVTPIIVKLDQYIQECTADQSFSDTHEGDDLQKINMVNVELKKLKQLLDISDITLAPDNVWTYLDANIYKKMKEQQTVAILTHLIQLTSRPFFTPDIEKYQDTMRAINFVHQLKNIFQEKRNAFELYAGKKSVLRHDVVKDVFDDAPQDIVEDIQHIPEEDVPDIFANDVDILPEYTVHDVLENCVDTISKHTSPEIKKTDYSYRIVADWENIIKNLDISDEITEYNYEIILEEYKEYIVSHENKQQLERVVGRRVGIYKTHVSRTNTRYWRGEAMIMIQSFFRKKDVEENSRFELRKKAEDKQLLQQQEQLRKQSVYFPQIIQALQQFVKSFKAEYFGKTPSEIREAFVQQYVSLVLEPTIAIDADLFSLSEKESNALDDKHRKKELHEGIISVISKGSDVLIERGMAQGFIFGEVNDLIEHLQKIYVENNS